MPPYRIGVDTGGTFTDLVVVDDESASVTTVKVSSTPNRPVDAVFEALARAPMSPRDVSYFVLGTTIATNCLLQRQGQRTLYLTTAGFEDIPHIQRVDRKTLYDLQWEKPEPFVARYDCFGVRERVAHDGSVRIPLDEEEIDRVAGLVERIDAEADTGVAVAINFLFAFVFPDHERRLESALRERVPHLPVSVSSQVAPIWREYERANTTIADAYLRRLTGQFAAELDQGLEERDLSCPRFLLKSNGGQIPTSRAARQPVNFMLSGLAGGLIGGKRFADLAGARDVITLDMGGTSADVGAVVAGRIRSRSHYDLEFGLPIAVPVIDLTTIGAGGSSIAGFDQGGFLKVGPESAGADPGPASYGRGAVEATLTDANLVLGRLNPDYFLGGELPLNVDRGTEAVRRVATTLRIGLEEAAQAIVEVASENMANAIRLLCTDRGLDYRNFDLEAFGGAGPLHAAQLARSIGLRRVLIPPNPGLTSAFGAQAAELRVDRRATRLLRSDLSSHEEFRGAVDEIAQTALAELESEGAVGELTLAVTVSSRYLGQNFELEISVPLDADGNLIDLMTERFHEEHRRVYGYRLDGTVVQFVHLNATAFEHREPAPPPRLEPGERGEPVDVRPVYYKDDGWMDTTIHRRPALPAGVAVAGPAIIEELDSTTLVLRGQEARVLENGILLIEELRTQDREPVVAEEGVARA